MTSEELKMSLPMRAVIEEYGLKISDKGFCRCPFHKEKTASMKIYKDSYYCFGCGTAGDIFSFVQKMDNCSFKDAFKRLGGTYKDGDDYQHNLHRYHMQKRRETELMRRQREEAERNQIIQEIPLQKAFKLLSPVFSDDWCDAVNRLEYLFYRLEYLTGKR